MVNKNSKDASLRVVVLPGMGADEKMYRGAWRTCPGFVFVDWPPYRGELTLGEVAQRIIDEHAVTGDDGLVGSSLGGMVALEVAARVGAAWACLVGSAEHASEISVFVRLAAPLAAITPLRLATVLTGSVASEALAADVDPVFIRAMCRAVVDWKPPAYDGKVLRIHGAEDHVIPCPVGATSIAGAGHLVALTHAEACVEALRSFIPDRL